MNDASKAATGVLSWTILEYFLHKELGHRLHTRLREQHLNHHRYPEQSSSPRWAAVALALLATNDPFLTGMVAGYFAYEWVHYRAHRALATGNPHLLHHGEPNCNYGVTTSWIDAILHTRCN